MGITATRLTYADYMCSPEERRRYEILDGEKIYMTNPTIRHQKVQQNLFVLLRSQLHTGLSGELLIAPIDVLIHRNPLQTRQPDILYISEERLGGRSFDNPAPLEPAPELVVEILSRSDTRRVLRDKLTDYAYVDVLECWVVSPGEQTVEVIRLSANGAESSGMYSVGDKAI